MNKEGVEHIYNGILMSHKKNCSNMDGPRDYHTKWSKSERARQISYNILYIWCLKVIYETETDALT